MSLRDDIVDNARWGADHEKDIHYTQAAGRMAAVHSPRSLPLYTDCSGFVTLCYAWAGAPDPNGRGFNGTGYCHEPSARVLTSDLRWVPAGDLGPGDELWAFEDVPASTRIGRTFQKATVLASFPSVKDCVRVHTSTDESFICSADHPWLSAASWTPGYGQHAWTHARDLLSRPELVRPFLPWEPDRSYDAGWLAGIFDGEGWVHNRAVRGGRTHALGITQVLGPTADRIEEVAGRYCDFRRDVIARDGVQKRINLASRGGFTAVASFLGTIRPDRLIRNFDLTGGHIQKNHLARVVAVEPIGLHEVQSIQTTTGTYFAEGFAVHNTGTLLDHLEHISKDELRPADLVVFGPYPGDHVVIVVEEGADPLTASHGQEKGPIAIRLSREVAAHRKPTFYLRGDGLDTPVPVEDDMTADQDKRLSDVENLSQATNAAVGRLEVAIGDPTNGLYVKFNSLEAQIAAIAKKVGA